MAEERPGRGSQKDKRRGLPSASGGERDTPDFATYLGGVLDKRPRLADQDSNPTLPADPPQFDETEPQTAQVSSDVPSEVASAASSRRDRSVSDPLGEETWVVEEKTSSRERRKADVAAKSSAPPAAPEQAAARPRTPRPMPALPPERRRGRPIAELVVGLAFGIAATLTYQELAPPDGESSTSGGPGLEASDVGTQELGLDRSDDEATVAAQPKANLPPGTRSPAPVARPPETESARARTARPPAPKPRQARPAPVPRSTPSAPQARPRATTPPRRSAPANAAGQSQTAGASRTTAPSQMDASRSVVLEQLDQATQLLASSKKEEPVKKMAAAQLQKARVEASKRRYEAALARLKTVRSLLGR